MIIEIHTFDTRIEKEDLSSSLRKSQLILASSIFSIMEATEATKSKFRNEYINTVIQIADPSGRIFPMPAYNSYDSLYKEWKKSLEEAK